MLQRAVFGITDAILGFGFFGRFVVFGEWLESCRGFK